MLHKVDIMVKATVMVLAHTPEDAVMKCAEFYKMASCVFPDKPSDDVLLGTVESITVDKS